MSAAQWLWLMIGLQLILFAAGWGMSARRATTWRLAMRGLAFFNICMGVGTALVGLRGIVPYALAYPLSNLVSLVAFILLWRAGQSLTGKIDSSREQLALLLTGGLLILWFGRTHETGGLRMASFCLFSAWIVMRGGWQGFRRLRLESLSAAAWVLLITGWTIAALYAWRALLSLSGQVEVEFDHASDTNNALALVMMVGVFSVNIVFAHLVFGRATAELQRLSRHDALTGLFNRRAIVESLHTEWERCKRSGVTFSVACIDIDHFKEVNDEFGHAAGDAALVGVAQQLRQCMRPGDGLGRCGGEEFLAVLNGCDRAEALVAAERLRLAICEKAGLHPDPQRRLTISIGVATVGTADHSAEDLLARGDAALYEAKAAGRNVVCQAADTIRRLKIVPRTEPAAD